MNVARAKRRPTRRAPAAASLQVATSLSQSRPGPCHVRSTFVRGAPDGSPASTRPSLARLVGRQAGANAEVRVKTMLTALWLARADQEWAAPGVPARLWAHLFGLGDPDRAGARRVINAMHALADDGLVTLSVSKGRAPRIQPRHESGDGRPWVSPVGAAGRPIAPEDRHFQLEAAFWANGWVCVLSARAITALCILLEATWGRRPDVGATKVVKDGIPVRERRALTPYHVTEEELAQCQVSRDMFDRGVAELKAWGLVDQRNRQARNELHWGQTRTWRQLRVRLEVLRTPVTDILAGRTPAVVGYRGGDDDTGTTPSGR